MLSAYKVREFETLFEPENFHGDESLIAAAACHHRLKELPKRLQNQVLRDLIQAAFEAQSPSRCLLVLFSTAVQNILDSANRNL